MEVTKKCFLCLKSGLTVTEKRGRDERRHFERD